MVCKTQSLLGQISPNYDAETPESTEMDTKNAPIFLALSCEASENSKWDCYKSEKTYKILHSIIAKGWKIMEKTPVASMELKESFDLDFKIMSELARVGG